MAESNSLDGSFGKLSVTAAERRQRISVVFDAIAPRYDLMNDLMSFGIHRLWKRKLARRVADVRGLTVDLAGGTGDVARLLVDGSRRVVICDPRLPMMKAGRGKMTYGSRRPTKVGAGGTASGRENDVSSLYWQTGDRRRALPPSPSPGEGATDLSAFGGKVSA